MVYIIIPVHNRKQFIRPCLRSLLNQVYSQIKIIIVDDGSTDGTSEIIRNEFPQVIILQGNGNLWWAEGMNVGIRYVLQQDYNDESFIITLNDDVEVAPDYVDQLLKVYNSQKPCLVGSISVDINSPLRLTYAGTKLNLFWAAHLDLANSLFSNNYNLIENEINFINTDSLIGRGVLIPITIFTKFGLFDSEHYKHYLADIEFSLRVRKGGIPLLVSSKAVVKEHTEATAGVGRSQITFFQFANGLFDSYSPIYLKSRLFFAKKYAKSGMLFFLIDVIRIWGSYFRQYIKK